MTSLQNNITTVQESLDNIRDAIISKGGIITSGITSYAIDLLNISVGPDREISPQGVFQFPITDFTFNLPSKVTDISRYALYYSFYNCTSLTSVNLSSLTTISGYSALYYSFGNCTSLTSVDLSSLAIIGDSALNYAFYGCTSLTSLSFPSLTSTSFGNYTNQFYNMLSGVTGCAVHFPSNLQSVISNWSSVTSGFGGTNTTVLFDLPATE